MSAPGTRFVLKGYAENEKCECRANAHEWKFCPKHQTLEDDRHLGILIEHEEKVKLIELLRS